MGDIVTKSAPYLYPFLIEFSLIGAAVLMVMWARIGKNPRYKYHDAIFVIRHRLQDNPFKQLTKSLIRNILDSGVMMTVTEFLLLRGKWSPTQGLIVLGLAKGFSLGFWFLSQHWYVSFSSLFWSIMENFMSHNLLSSSPTSATLPLWFSLFLQYYWDFAGEIWEKSKTSFKNTIGGLDKLWGCLTSGRHQSLIVIRSFAASVAHCVVSFLPIVSISGLGRWSSMGRTTPFWQTFYSRFENF